MSNWLSELELGRLRMSVGYARQKKGRPLSPVEVGEALRSARTRGMSLRDCAEMIQLSGTGHIGRFLQILSLPAEVLHLVDWGAGKDFIGFTCAVELTRLRKAEDQAFVAEAILKEGLNSREVRQVAQTRARAALPIGQCVQAVVRMRPKVHRRYVFVGSVKDEQVTALKALSQQERNSVMSAAIDRLGLRGAVGRLGVKFFTLVGADEFDASMNEVGRNNVEVQLRSYIVELLGDGLDRC